MMEKSEECLKSTVKVLSVLTELPIIYKSHKCENGEQYEYVVGIELGPNCMTPFIPPLPIEQAEICTWAIVRAIRIYKNLKLRNR